MNWSERLDRYSKQTGYIKPDYNRDATKMDSNENIAISRDFQTELIDQAKKSADVRFYPLESAQRLISAISEYVQVPPEMIGVGNGSDQILDLILGNFAKPGTKVLVSDPTFSFFEERCKLYDIEMIRVPFSADMTLDAGQLESSADGCDMIYLDSPNNPTGHQPSRPDITRIIESFDGPVIIDEAYAEFGGYSLVDLAKTSPNLVIVRTLSKSFGLAGLRLGYLVSDKRFTDTFNRVIQYPYPLSSIGVEAGILALKQRDKLRPVFEMISSERKRIIDTLRGYDSFDVFDSAANFVLFDAKGADKRIYTALLEQGISIRRIGAIGSHEGCLRVTVGAKETNSKFLLAIRDLLQ